MKKVLAIDIETTGLDPWRDQIHMVGLWRETEHGQGYVCCRSKKQLQAWLTDYDDYALVGHNVAFDIKFLEVQGWWEPDGRTIHDTKIMAHLVHDKVPQSFIEVYEADRRVLNKDLPKGQGHREASGLSLKVLAPWYLKVPRFWENPTNHNDEEYNKKDCVYTYKLFELLHAKLEDQGSLEFYERMLSWSTMVREMEIKGISISMDELQKVEEEYTHKRDTLKIKLDEQWAEAIQAHYDLQRLTLGQKYKEMLDKAVVKAKDREKCVRRYHQLYHEATLKIEPFNYSSPAQMTWLLKDYLNLDITDPEGEETTGKAVLHRLASEGREDIKTFLDWREADKVLTMYLPTYKKLQVDAVIHPSFNLTGTRTGRISSSGPNLQQVPPKLYRLFKPRRGYRFIQYDLSGIEAALIALYSGDKRLFEILEKGESMHDHNVKALFGYDTPIEEVAKAHAKERKAVKNIGFALFYGAYWHRIQTVFANGGFILTDKQSKEKFEMLKAYYPQAFEFHKEITEVFEAGEVVRNLLGRPIKLQPHDNPYMQGFNTLIQSSASDLNLRACEKAWLKWKEQGMEAYPLLVIHDCIVAEAHKDVADQAAEILQQSMTGFKLESVNGIIQLKVEGGVSDAWEK